VNEAYATLSDCLRRRNYDEFKFGEIVPMSSYKMFNDFFNNKPFLSTADDLLFRPLMMKAPLQMQMDMGKDWINIEALENSPSTKYAETCKSSTVQECGPQGLCGKTTTEKSILKDGKKKCIKIEEILKPNGSKEVTETICEGFETKTNKYLLAPG